MRISDWSSDVCSSDLYLGQRGSQEIRGAAAGAEFWFGRELGDLSTEQIAMLIGLVKGPPAYHPRRHPENALERRNFVLVKVHESPPQLLAHAEYQPALKAPLGVPAGPEIGTGWGRGRERQG